MRFLRLSVRTLGAEATLRCCAVRSRQQAEVLAPHGAKPHMPTRPEACRWIAAASSD